MVPSNFTQNFCDSLIKVCSARAFICNFSVYFRMTYTEETKMAEMNLGAVVPSYEYRNFHYKAIKIGSIWYLVDASCGWSGKFRLGLVLC